MVNHAEFNMVNIFEISIVSMLIVFSCLIAIMYIMKMLGNYFSTYEKQNAVSQKTTESLSPGQTNLSKMTKAEVFEQNPLAQVAVIVALAHAADNMPDRHFVVENIIKK